MLHRDINLPGSLKPKNQPNWHLFWKQSIKSGVLTYPRVIQCDNESEFKDEVTKLLEKLNVEI